MISIKIFWWYYRKDYYIDLLNINYNTLVLMIGNLNTDISSAWILENVSKHIEFGRKASSNIQLKEFISLYFREFLNIDIHPAILRFIETLIKMAIEPEIMVEIDIDLIKSVDLHLLIDIKEIEKIQYEHWEVPLTNGVDFLITKSMTVHYYWETIKTVLYHFGYRYVLQYVEYISIAYLEYRICNS